MPYAFQANDLYYALDKLVGKKKKTGENELSNQEIADKLNRIAMAPAGQQQPSLPGEEGSVVVESIEKRTFDKWRKFLKERQKND